MNNIKYSVRNFCFHFGDAYSALQERGLITEDQLDKIVNLLDKLEDYPPELFKERLTKIFAENILK